MLISPSPRVLMASAGSKPLPVSRTVKCSMVGRSAQLDIEPPIPAVLHHVVGRLLQHTKEAERNVSGNGLWNVGVREMNLHFLLL